MKRKNHVSLIIMIALSLFGSYHIYYYFLDKGSNDLVRNYYVETPPKEDSQKIVQNINNAVQEKYLGILRIPKINLKEGFYNIDSKKNNINKSVTILKESIMPNMNGSIIYLIAHSGYGYLAFFKDLNKLDINDLIYLDINNNTYQYVINDVYEVNKTGKIPVNHNINEKYLILSTCSENKNKQLVITSKLVNTN